MKRVCLYVLVNVSTDIRYVVIDFFFFKQKTAYEMRISYWSSDVCSSDLPEAIRAAFASDQRVAGSEPFVDCLCRPTADRSLVLAELAQPIEDFEILQRMDIAGDHLSERAHLGAPSGIGGQ